MTESYLKQEILEQPDVLRRLLENEQVAILRAAQIIREYDPHYILLVARGSSDNAARYGQYLFGSMNRIPVALATPSLYTVYDAPPHLHRALVLAISQSGQSPDMWRSLKMAGSRVR
jgi:glutamine---fructose-6-phosphate transaminase (isomerizing)